jgi:hypothetical protein
MILLSFAFGFYILSLDSVLYSFKDIISSLGTVFISGLAGAFDYSEYLQMDQTVGPLTFVVFLFISAVVMTNSLIAIISKEYERAEENGYYMWVNQVCVYGCLVCVLCIVFVGVCA